MAKEIESDEFKKLITLGEEKGFLTYDDVNDLLPSDVISSDQIDDIIMLFGEKNIDIIDSDKGEKLVVKKAADERVEIKREDILGLLPAVGRTGDPVKMYLREMGLVSLLSREGEVEIAKVIEEGAQESMEAVFSVNVSLKDVVNIGAQLKSGAIRVKSVVDNLEDEDGVMEEDMHRERVIKLLDKVTVLDGKNDADPKEAEREEGSAPRRGRNSKRIWTRTSGISSSSAGRSGSARDRSTGWWPISAFISTRWSRRKRRSAGARRKRVFPWPRWKRPGRR